MNAAFFLIGYFLVSIGVLLTLSRMEGVPMWGTMAAGFVLAGIGVLYALRRFTLDDGAADDPFAPFRTETDDAPADAPEEAQVRETTGTPTL